MADGVQYQWSVRSNSLRTIIAGLGPKAEMIVAKAAMDIEANAKQNAPVDTGTLKNSIQATKIGKYVWRVIVGADYGMYVEWGTARMGAQPYFQPAIMAVRPAFIQALRTVLK